MKWNLLSLFGFLLGIASLPWLILCEKTEINLVIFAVAMFIALIAVLTGAIKAPMPEENDEDSK